MERSCLGSEGDNSSGFLWPQRNYTCSFCKRQFNSAQALGGHMNVHRRDRAMLIQLPSWVFHQYPNPNPKSHPNPKFSSSSTSCSASTLLPYNYTHHRFLSPSSYEEKKPTTHIEASAPLSEDLTEKMKKKNMTSVVEVEELKEELEVFKKSELISLDLEIGCKDPKEVLDLELRLGCF